MPDPRQDADPSTGTGAPSTPASGPVRAPQTVVRVAAWVVYLSIPLLGLRLLIARPQLDTQMRHDGAHFWLVLGSAAVSLALAVALLRAARRRGDARLFLVSLVFQVNAGFLGLHALATPGVLVHGPNGGFDAATPVGLVLGGVAAVASSVNFGPDGARRLMRWQGVIGAVPWALFAVWAIAELAGLPRWREAPTTCGSPVRCRAWPSPPSRCT